MVRTEAARLDLLTAKARGFGSVADIVASPNSCAVVARASVCVGSGPATIPSRISVHPSLDS